MRPSGLWGHPDFVRPWAAATVSTLGSLLSRTALPFAAILVLEAGPLQVGLLTAAELAPAFLVGLVAGVWVDRLPRRPVLIGADLGRAALLATVPLAALFGALSLGQLYVVAAAGGVLTVCFDVAYRSYLPTLLDRDELMEGNAKLSASGAVAEAVAFGGGGWLVQWLTAPVAVLLDALSFLVSALFVSRIAAPEPPPTPTAARLGIGREIGEGVRVLAAEPTLRALAASNAVLNLGYSVIGAVFLLYVTRGLGFGPGVLGLIFAVGGVGSLLGAAAAGRVAGWRIGVGPAMIAALALVAAGQGLVPLATGAGALAVALLVGQQVVADVAATVYEVTQVSLRQAITPDRLLGRVTAGTRVLEVGAMLVGSLLGGVLGETVGLRATLVAGVAVQGGAALWLWASPARGLRRLPPLPGGGDGVELAQ